MSAIKPTITDLSVSGRGAAYLVVWANVTEADTCVPVAMPANAARSIQAVGTFGGASVALGGGNDGTFFADLNDASGSPIGLSADGLSTIQERAAFYQPAASGGSGQAIDITMLFTA